MELNCDGHQEEASVMASEKFAADLQLLTDKETSEKNHDTCSSLPAPKHDQSEDALQQAMYDDMK
jgi:hypothetical protein